jgi:uncharacterized protein involved in tolerance to divalent cations
LPRRAALRAGRAYNPRMSALLEVQTGLGSHEDATRIGRRLVEERLAACAQVLPGVESVYRWEGMLRHDSEHMLTLKTTEAAWPRLRDRLIELHPYDTPQITAVAIAQASFEYAAWVRGCCE